MHKNFHFDFQSKIFTGNAVMLSKIKLSKVKFRIKAIYRKRTISLSYYLSKKHVRLWVQRKCKKLSTTKNVFCGAILPLIATRLFIFSPTESILIV